MSVYLMIREPIYQNAVIRPITYKSTRKIPELHKSILPLYKNSGIKDIKFDWLRQLSTKLNRQAHW